MEGIYKWVVKYQEMLSVPVKKPEHKLEIYFFATNEEYRKYMALTLGDIIPSAIGFYVRDENRSAFFDLADEPGIAAMKRQLAEPGVDFRQKRLITNRMNRWSDHYNYTVIQHECAHHIHFNTGVFPKRGDMPRWMTEGLACMFETPPSDAGGSLGSVNHSRLNRFRQIYDWEPRRGTDYRRLGDLRLFIVDDSQFQGEPSYALGWAIHQYLWKAHRPKYAQYMQKMAAREEDVDVDQTKRQQEFEDLFGEVNEEWIKKFIEYINSLQLKPSLLPE
jgi:hypothetical protein